MPIFLHFLKIYSIIISFRKLLFFYKEFNFKLVNKLLHMVTNDNSLSIVKNSFENRFL